MAWLIIIEGFWRSWYYCYHLMVSYYLPGRWSVLRRFWCSHPLQEVSSIPTCKHAMDKSCPFEVPR